MDQQSDVRSNSGSSINGEKRHRSKHDKKGGSSSSSNSGKRRHADDATTPVNGQGHNLVRRSSVSKPARDLLDEPEKKVRKRNRHHRRHMKEDAKKDDNKGEDKAEDNTETPLVMSKANSPVIDFDGLSRPSFGTRQRLEESAEKQAERLDRMKGAVRTLLECVGEDPDREGLLATPERYAKAMLFFTQGYQENVRDIVNTAVFQEGHNEMVIVKDIDIFSVCEHHLVPFTGKMHIGYIPSNAVIGISKLPRIADMFARRLQIQERLTKEVANAIFEVLQPQGVAVVMESSHLCMVMRGVQKVGSSTVTSCVLGCFERREKTRNEFLSLVGIGRH
ncbi:GTP cyclohydrolase 1 [Cladobotryum mycophilum]|uniref:GTP cyclohydrolase 1 n=1 Tax=Cladobotryum mycophilum TaxID=491253 RepID=A0ABR0S9G3_9HYPO